MDKVKVQRWNSTTNRPCSRIMYVTKKSNTFKYAVAGICGWRVIQ